MKVRVITLALGILIPLVPAFSATAPKAGAICAKQGLTQTYSGKKYTCVKSGKKLVWDKGVVIKKAAPTPTAGNSCTKIGLRVFDETSYLECRWTKGKKLIWIRLSKNPLPFANPKSAVAVSNCKLIGDDLGSTILGFGPSSENNFRLTRRTVPPIGINKALIVPVDFSDYPGEADLKQTIERQRNLYLQWIDYYSAGKLNVQLDFIPNWVRAPMPSTEYNLDNIKDSLDKRTSAGDELTRVYAQKFIDFITKQIDLRQYQTVYILYPKSQKTLRDFVPRVKYYDVKEGRALLSVFAPGVFSLNRGMPYWAFWIHETGHDWGLKGHAPGDGWPVGIMQNQDGFLLNPSAWDQFLMTWLPDEQVYCDLKSDLKTTEIRLSPLQREDKQTKMVGIVLDSSRLLVIESYGIDKWADRRLDSSAQYYDFDEHGFYAVTAYIVDTREQGQLVRDSQGSNLDTDDGNNNAVPRQAKFYPVEGQASNSYGLNKFGGNLRNDNYFAVQDDSFLIEGIRITFVKADDYNTIKIEKASN